MRLELSTNRKYVDGLTAWHFQQYLVMVMVSESVSVMVIVSVPVIADVSVSVIVMMSVVSVVFVLDWSWGVVSVSLVHNLGLESSLRVHDLMQR